MISMTGSSRPAQLSSQLALGVLAVELDVLACEQHALGRRWGSCRATVVVNFVAVGRAHR